MYLLLDVGGTHTRMAFSTDGIDLNRLEVIHTPKYFEELLKITKQFTAGTEIKKIAGGLAGVLDTEKRLLLKSNLPEWNYQPIADLLEETFDAEVFLENDAALEALGEAHYGNGVGVKVLAYMVVGTGVGGARIVQGKIDHKTYGFEIGHQIISPAGPPCPFGDGNGHLISYVSGAALFNTHHKHSEEIDDPEVWDEVTKKLAVGLNNAAVFWSPETIILSGSVTKKIDFAKLNNYLSKYLTIFPDVPKILQAKLDNPGIYGGLEYLKQQT